MKNKFLWLPALLLMAGCSSEPILMDNMDNPVDQGSGTARFIHSRSISKATELLVKFRPQYAQSIENSVEAAKSRGQSSRSGLNNFDNFLATTDAVSFERVFPIGKYEERTRKSGLHLWYKVVFDTTLPADKLKKSLMAVPEISAVEFLAPLRLIDGTAQKAMVTLPANSVSRAANKVNDPGVSQQWHYSNNGLAIPHAVAGADINLFKAWEKTMGNKNVIVGVVDEMIDYNHPDLQDNMWVNQLEANGQKGVDDDGNGYVDDVYGFNFVSGMPDGDFGFHGTHVGGTISAVNNNGEGVAGIAGGSGSGDGVRLMTCGIFSSKGYNNPTVLAYAIKYAADNGAVILQNSWGYDEPNLNWEEESFFSIERQSLEYFIQNAGKDENGKVTGPMSGGIVIFAAGNSGHIVGNRALWPAAHSDFISVSSVGCDYRPAYYTCFGPWVDIAAPGGDQVFDDDKGGVLSTAIGNRIGEYGYAFLQGTSMACPHVSGVAALVVSYAKDKNYPLTNTELKDIILSSGLNIDAYATGKKEIKGSKDQAPLYVNLSDYQHQMGNGLIDAALALERLDQLMGIPSDHTAPSAVETVEVPEGKDPGCIKLRWKLTADCHNHPLQSYSIYYSARTIEVKNGKVVQNSDVEGPVMVPVKDGAQIGDWMETLLTGLSNVSQYHFAIVGHDQWRASSQPLLFTGKSVDIEAAVSLNNLKIMGKTSHSIALQWEEKLDGRGEPYLSYQIGYYMGDRDPNQITYLSVHALGKEGTVYSGNLDHLLPNTTYHIEVMAFDRNANPSQINTIEATTLPKIESESELPLLVQYWEEKTFGFKLNDTDFSKTKVSLLTPKTGWNLETETDRFELHFSGDGSLEGDDKLPLIVEDEFLGKFKIEIPYTVIANSAPEVVETIPDQYVESLSGKLTLDLDRYFADANNESLTYSVVSADNKVDVVIDGNIMQISAVKNGLSDIRIRATDHGKKLVEQSFQVMVRASYYAMDLYPNPVKDIMYIRMGKDMEGPVKVKIKAYNGSVLRETAAEVSPYRPARIDVKGLNPGQLMVEVEYNGHIYKGNVVKL